MVDGLHVDDARSIVFARSYYDDASGRDCLVFHADKRSYLGSGKRGPA